MMKPGGGIRLLVAAAAFAIACVSFAATQAIALAQHATTATSATSQTGDPLNALWSLIGSSTVGAVLLLWVRSEKADRQEERTERRAANASKDQLVEKLVKLIEADTENKRAITERLKGQDDVLTKLLAAQQALERTVADPRRPRGGP
jgi:membrane protein implicated in regulation of membrane protease activity